MKRFCDADLNHGSDDKIFPGLGRRAKEEPPGLNQSIHPHRSRNFNDFCSSKIMHYDRALVVAIVIYL